MGYIILLFIILLIHIVFSYKFKRYKNLELICYMTAFFIFIGFRGINVGADTKVYIREYLTMGKMTFSEAFIAYSGSFEFGFIIFSKLVYFLLPFKQGILLAQAFITVICYYSFIKKCCPKNYFLSVLIFMAFGLLNFHLTGIRQSIAMSICVYTYSQFDEKKYIKIILCILLASTIHKSAMVFLLAVLWGILWKNHNNISVNFGGMILMYLSAGKIQALVSSFRSRWEMYGNVESTGNGYIFLLVLLSVIAVSQIVVQKLNGKEKIHLRVSYLALILWTGRLVSRTFERPCLYFLPSYMALFPDSIYAMKNPDNKKIVYYGAVVCLCLFYIYRYGRMYYGLV